MHVRARAFRTNVSFTGCQCDPQTQPSPWITCSKSAKRLHIIKLSAIEHQMADANGEYHDQHRCSTAKGQCQCCECDTYKDPDSIISTGSGMTHGRPPFLSGGGEQLHTESLQECEKLCKSDSRCRLGTFISSYGQRGECWLATTSLQTALPCIRHCESFVKVKKSHAIETRIRPKMPSTNESNGQESAVLSVLEQGAVVLAENSISNSTLKAAPAQSSLDHLNCSKSKGFCPVGKYSAMSPWTHHAGCYLCPSSKFAKLSVVSGGSAGSTARYCQGTCESCPKGRYQHDYGSLQCKKKTLAPTPRAACVVGQTKNKTTQACIDCSEGRFGKMFLGAPLCYACPPGKYQGLMGRSHCVSCPLGQHQHYFGKRRCFGSERAGY